MKMYNQATPQQKFYSSGTKEAAKLEKEGSKKTAVLQKAYEAAVADLGFSDKELMDAGKAKQVAKLMFGTKYLGNAKFNPLLKDKKFGEKSYIDQQRAYQQMFDVNLDNFAGDKGIIERYGGLRRAMMTEAVQRQADGLDRQRLMSFAWNQVYDPGKSLQENMEAYVEVIQEDPILAHTGAKIDGGKFASIDEAADVIASSMMGKTNRETFQYKHGADFN